MFLFYLLNTIAKDRIVSWLYLQKKSSNSLNFEILMRISGDTLDNFAAFFILAGARVHNSILK